MFDFKWGIFVGFVVMIMLEYGLEFLNLEQMRTCGDTIPPVFKGRIDQTLLSRTRNYLEEKTRFGWCKSLAEQVIVAGFLFGGGLNLYNNWIVNMQLSFMPAGIVFILILSTLKLLLNLPFDWHQTFVIEAKYGFNTTTPQLWVKDLIKSFLLSAILLSLLISGGLFLVAAFPELWWLVVWSFFFIFSLFIMFISPYVLEPMFNKFTLLEDPHWLEPIREVAAKAGIAVSRVFKKNASLRSKHTNAYFTGIGKVKRIVLYDTLLETMTPDEVKAILAHEAGHWKKRHLLKRLLISQGSALLVLYLAFFVTNNDWLGNYFGLEQNTFMAKLLLFGFCLSIVFFPIGPVMSWFSRVHEREADRFAIQLLGGSEDLVQALVKLSKDNLSNLHPHPWYAAWYYSHPPVVQRIEQLKKVKAALK